MIYFFHKTSLSVSNFLLPLILVISNSALAVESICPGGSNPRADISWCADHENFASNKCKIGDEQECSDEAGYEGKSHQTIKRTQAAIGSGAIEGIAEPGGTGPGYLVIPAQPPSLAASLRFYVKFSKGYLLSNWDRGNHGPSLQSEGKECSIVYSLDWADTGPSMILQSDCSTTFLVPNNIKNYPMKNNVWYLVELQAKMNTTTSGPGEFDGNGELRLYVNGEKLLEYTNVNLRGNTNELWSSGYAARSYYSLGVPSWSGTLSHDGFIYSKNGSYIGPSLDENPRGTPDPKSPYVNFASYNGYVGSKMANDCTSPGSSIHYTPLDLAWRNETATSLSSEVTHRGYKNSCAPELLSAPQIILKDLDDSSRIKGSNIDNSNNLSLKGRILIPSTGSLASSPALVGFYKNNGTINQLALTLQNNKWAIRQKGLNLDSVIRSSTITVEKDIWNDFELNLTRSSNLSLKINNQIVIPPFTPTNLPTWAWENTGGSIMLGQLTEPSKTPDKALKVSLRKSSDGGGVSYEMIPGSRVNAFTVHGWIYLPSTNQSSSSPIALSGFTSNNGTDNVAESYLALGIKDNKWAVVDGRNGIPNVSFLSDKSISLNAWHEFELITEKSGVTSLMIDREWLLDSQQLDTSLDWIWDDSLGGLKQIVFGVIDFQGAAPFTIYTDDTDALSASAWSCKGWSSESCPF